MNLDDLDRDGSVAPEGSDREAAAESPAGSPRKSRLKADRTFEATVTSALVQQGLDDVWPVSSVGCFVALAARACGEIAESSIAALQPDPSFSDRLRSTQVRARCVSFYELQQNYSPVVSRFFKDLFVHSTRQHDAHLSIPHTFTSLPYHRQFQAQLLSHCATCGKLLFGTAWQSVFQLLASAPGAFFVC